MSRAHERMTLHPDRPQPALEEMPLNRAARRALIRAARGAPAKQHPAHVTRIDNNGARLSRQRSVATSRGTSSMPASGFTR